MNLLSKGFRAFTQMLHKQSFWRGPFLMPLLSLGLNDAEYSKAYESNLSFAAFCRSCLFSASQTDKCGARKSLLFAVKTEYKVKQRNIRKGNSVKKS